MSIAHESTSGPIPVEIRPGYWLAHTVEGRIIACCEEPRELDREVQKAGLDPANVLLLRLPDQNDDELLLGGCEWSLDEERLHRTPALATAGDSVSPGSPVPSNV